MSELYGEDYFRKSCGRPYERTPEWLEGNSRLAERIVATLAPASALDAGCAMGFLVEALRARGVEAFGIDISSYAIEKVLPEMRPFCRVGSVLDPLPRRYDLIICNEVLEHLQPAEGPLAVANLCRHSDDILFCSTPFDYRESTHFNVRPPEYWAELFAHCGFLRDVDYDTTFLAPWALRFRRSQEPLPRVVAAYERQAWRLEQEAAGQREVGLERGRQIADLEARLREAENSQQASDRRAAELSTRQEELQARAAELTSARERLAQSERECAENAERARAAENALAGTRATLAALQGEHAALRGREANLERIANELQGTLLEADTDRRRQAQRAADLEQHLLRVYNSLSMRLTSPLRRALMFLRGQPPAGGTPQPASRLRAAWIEAVDLARRGWRVLRQEGPLSLVRKGWRLMGRRRAATAVSGAFESSPVPSAAAPSGDWKRVRPKLLPTPRSLRVLFFNGQGDRNGDWSQSPRYRVHNVRAALAMAGIDSSRVTTSDLPLDLHVLADHDLLVLFRAGWTAELELLVNAARHFHVPVVYDVDDYVFEPRLATPKYISGIAGWPEAERKRYVEGVEGFRRALELCDYFTGSTEYLVERARELGKPGAVVRNGPGEELIRLSQEARGARHDASGSQAVRLLYMSGTATHQRDFAAAAGALAAVMHERPHVRLHIIGPLDLTEFDLLAPMHARIERTEFLDWRLLPGQIARADINLAPLELGNPFCEAKSEIKYSEAALLGVPTIASATDTYARAIRDGVNGSVCAGEPEWRSKMLRLIDDAGERRRMGEAALAEVLDSYDPTSIAEQARTAYRRFAGAYRTGRERTAASLELGWVVTPPAAGSGGHNAIFLAANEMVNQGHSVVVYMPEASEGGAAIREAIRRDFQIDPQFEVVSGSPEVFSHDALIATHYSTAHFVARHAARSFLSAYFVQDFEPFFSPVGSEYFDAERTYRYPFYCVTVGEWLAERLRSGFGRDADAVPFWVNKALYSPGGERSGDGPLRVAFLARPDMPRRCFTLGIQGLSIFKRDFPGAQVVLFGARGLPRQAIDFDFEDAGVLAKKDLAGLYRRSHIGMAFSTTNPSLVPLEMMACGLPVVDLDVLDSRRRLAGNPALLAEATPEGVAAALAALARSPERRLALRRAGLDFAANLPTPHEALAQVGRLILRKLA